MCALIYLCICWDFLNLGTVSSIYSAPLIKLLSDCTTYMDLMKLFFKSMQQCDLSLDLTSVAKLEKETIRKLGVTRGGFHLGNLTHLMYTGSFFFFFFRIIVRDIY